GPKRVAPEQYARRRRARLSRASSELLQCLRREERASSFSYVADFSGVITEVVAGGIFTLAVFLKHNGASRRPRRRLTARLHQIGRIFDHGGEIALARAAQVPVRLIFDVAGVQGWADIPRPLPARPCLRDQLRIVELDAGE